MLADATSASNQEARTTVSGGELPHAIRLTAADEDGFRRRINYPPVYTRTTPEVSGPSWTVTSTYWEPVIQTERRHPGAVDPDAAYYPEVGIVRANQDGEDVYLTLGVRQRAILDRYIRLGIAGELGEQPGTLDVLRAAATSEEIGIQIGTRMLGDQERAGFWSAVAGAERRPLGAGEDKLIERYQVSPEAGDLWIVFTLVEGRSLRLIYEPGAGRLYDALGREAYDLGANVLETAVGNGASFQAMSVTQEESPGSLLWWLLVPVALGLLATAFWLQRRFAAT
jgi:hypothetical protein